MKEKHIWIIIFLRLWVLYITKISFKRSKIIFHSQNMFFFFYSKNICWWHHHPLSCPNWIPGSHPWLRPFPHFPPQQSQVPLNLPTVCFSASLPHFSPQGSCLQLPHQSTTVVAVVPYLEPCLWSLPPIHLPHRMIYLEQEHIFQQLPTAFRMKVKVPGRAEEGSRITLSFQPLLPSIPRFALPTLATWLLCACPSVPWCFSPPWFFQTRSCSWPIHYFLHLSAFRCHYSILYSGL